MATRRSPYAEVVGKELLKPTSNGKGTHRYFSKVYALDTTPNLVPNSRKKIVERATAGHILAKGEIVGLYRRR